MTALLAYGIDVNSGTTQFAIVADEAQARYVWPALGEPIFDDARIQEIASLQGVMPDTPQGWMDVASYNLGLTTQITDPHTVEDLSSAIAETRITLNAARAQLGPGSTVDPGVLSRARESFDQISMDYPGFGEDETDDDPQAMTNFVMHMLGGIDPEGPNAWILEQGGDGADDTPPGGFVHLPGYDYNLVPVPDAPVDQPAPDDTTQEGEG